MNFNEWLATIPEDEIKNLSLADAWNAAIVSVIFNCSLLTTTSSKKENI